MTLIPVVSPERSGVIIRAGIVAVGETADGKPTDDAICKSALSAV